MHLKWDRRTADLLNIAADGLCIAPHNCIVSAIFNLSFNLLAVLIMVTGYKETVSPAGDRTGIIDQASSLLFIEVGTYYGRIQRLLCNLLQ